MRRERKYLLYRSWGNRVPVMRWIPKNLSTMEIRDMLPVDMVGKYAIVTGRSWDDAWRRNVTNVQTLVIDK